MKLSSKRTILQDFFLSSQNSPHSKKGAQTNAILFSLVESCKLNNVNPRKYFKDLVEDIHQGKETSTPYQYKKKLSEDSSAKDDYG